MRELKPGVNDVGRRLDRVVRRLFPALPLSRLFQAIRTGEITIAGRTVEGGYRLRAGDTIHVGGRLVDSLDAGAGHGKRGSRSKPGAKAGQRPAAEGGRRAHREERPAAAPLPAWLEPAIIFENQHLLALNKPRGLLVHGEGSIEEAVGSYLAPRLPPSLSFVPGPLHRLDRNTTGLLLFGRSLEGARLFTALLRAGKVAKLYLALLEGRLDREERWEDSLKRDRRARITRQGAAGRVARTIARPLLGDGRYTLAAIRIETGLTHQIRAQAALHGHPLAGDRKYGAASLPGGYLLHAWILELGAEGGPLGVARLIAPPHASSLSTLHRLFGSEPVGRLLASPEAFTKP